MNSLQKHRHHLRKPRIWLLVVAAIIVSITFNTCRSRIEAQADMIDSLVYCSTTVQVVFPDRRFLGSIGHSPKGSIETIQTSMEMLDHSGMPPKPWPKDWYFTTHGSDCYGSWEAMYDALNVGSLGRIAGFLDQSAPLDEVNFRQAVLKLLFKNQFETADKLFPPARVTIGDE